MIHYCELCDKEFSSKGSLVRHLETIKHKRAIENDGITNNKMIYACDRCETEYTSKQGLTAHFKTDKHKNAKEFNNNINNKSISMDFRVIPLYDKYIIYEDGEIFNIVTKIKPKISLVKGTLVVSLQDSNKINKSFTYRRLIYEVWYGIKLIDKDKIKFRDNDKNNHHYTNLINVNGPDKHLTHMPLDPAKEWKIVEEFDNYKVSNYGDVFSIFSNKILINQISDDGYECINLNSSKPHKFYIHRLVFQTHIGIIPKDKEVDHENRNRRDNYIGNLRLLTSSENNKNRELPKAKTREIHQYTLCNKFIKVWECVQDIEDKLGFDKSGIYSCGLGNQKSSSEFIWKYPEHVRVTNLMGYKMIETNDEFTYSKYKINKDGIILNKNNFIKVIYLKGEYKKINLKPDFGKSHGYFVHRLVAMTFLPNNNPENNVVNHLDENKSNPNVNNLQWTTNAENIKYSLGIKINQICLKTGEILFVYNSVTDANAAIKKNRSYSGIYDTCNGKRNDSAGFGWKYV